METNNLTLDQLQHMQLIIENHNIKKDYQAIEAILPMALVLIKSKIQDVHDSQNESQFYVPNLVNYLLHRLSNNVEPLSKEEYQFMRGQVAQLSMSDFKPANSDIMGYHLQVLTVQEISEMILALKHFFQLI